MDRNTELPQGVLEEIIQHVYLKQSINEEIYPMFQPSIPEKELVTVRDYLFSDRKDEIVKGMWVDVDPEEGGSSLAIISSIYGSQVYVYSLVWGEDKVSAKRCVPRFDLLPIVDSSLSPHIKKETVELVSEDDFRDAPAGTVMERAGQYIVKIKTGIDEDTPIYSYLGVFNEKFDPAIMEALGPWKVLHWGDE